MKTERELRAEYERLRALAFQDVDDLSAGRKKDVASRLLDWLADKVVSLFTPTP